MHVHLRHCLGVLVSSLLLVGTAQAVIIRLTPLADLVAESTFIATATVEDLDPERPAMVLALDRQLKGKAPFSKMPVNLKGDAIAAKGKESPQLLKRLAPKLPLVVFISARDKEYMAFVYTNGTWFGMGGVSADGGVVWKLNHAEPYLRRTFKGPTKEMVSTVEDALSGKRKPPPPNAKEKPGFGPEVEKKEGARLEAQEEEPVLAVIPTVLVGGPLAMLAMLFPSVFGGWRKWLALLSVAGTNSTLFTLHWLLADRLAGSWWFRPEALYTAMVLVNIVGLAWAWKRYTQRAMTGDVGRPGRLELALLLVMSLAGSGVLVWSWRSAQNLLDPQWLPLLIFTLAAWATFLHVAWARMWLPTALPASATEVVMLTALLLVGVVLEAVRFPGKASARPLVVRAAGEEEGVPPKLLWSFRLPAAGAIDSTPLVAGDRVLVSAAHDSAFSPYGAVYCLERDTGKVVWTFNDGKKMKPVFSSPVLADGKVYVGEGYHQDAFCKVFCLSADKGEKLWEFQTGSHTESTPVVADGRCYFGAGDDGLYCLTADKGQEVWHFPGFHIDASPLVLDGRVYAGCGVGDYHKTTAVVCVDAKTGSPVWRAATDLPVWGRPVPGCGRVCFATGNGQLNISAEKPAGAVVCADQKDGKPVWTHKLPDAVMGRLAAVGGLVYAGCRDGYLYALDRGEGGVAWRRDLGAPVVSAPAVVRQAGDGLPVGVYAVSSAGQLVCLAPYSGRVLWQMDLEKEMGSEVEVHAAPVADAGERRRVYVAATMVSSGRVGELRCYEESPTP